MRIVYIARITGKTGVWAVKKNIALLKSIYEPDFIIANADAATGAGGLGKKHAGYLKKMGINCITGGDCIFQKKDLVEALPELPFVLRPLNMPLQSPGHGFRCFITKDKQKLAVVSLLGRVGHYRLLADNPFTVMQHILPDIQKETLNILVDFSAFATAEKQAMAFFLAGRVSALIGSGTGAATADNRLLQAAGGSEPAEAGGSVDCFSGLCTAAITDSGRTGSFDSVGGYVPAGKIQEYRTGLYEYPQDSWQRICVQGLYIALDGNGNAAAAERIHLEYPSGEIQHNTSYTEERNTLCKK